MDILQLKLLVSVSHTLSFTRTAENFFMTQPAVSHQIKSLEQNLGVKLMERNPHRVALTPEGEEYVAFAKKIVAMQDEAENRLHNMKNGRTGHLRIALLSSAAQDFSRCLCEYSRSFPQIQVDADMAEGDGMLNLISRQNHDIYFAHEHMLPTAGELFEYAVTGEEQLCLFFHRDIAGSINMSDWSTVACHRFVSVPESDMTLAAQIKNICAERVIYPDVICRSSRADAVLLSVNAGIGVAILPQGAADIFRCPNVVGLAIEGEAATIKPVIAWAKDSTNPAVAGFAEIAREYARKNRSAGRK